MPPPFWTIGCLSGATSVLLGAFGAHGLKKHIDDPQRLATWSTASHYHMLHSAVLTFASVAAPRNTLALGLLTAGMGLFSGSLYALVLVPEMRWLGPVTPVGGVALVAGWVVLGVRGRGMRGFR